MIHYDVVDVKTGKRHGDFISEVQVNVEDTISIHAREYVVQSRSIKVELIKTSVVLFVKSPR